MGLILLAVVVMVALGGAFLLGSGLNSKPQGDQGELETNKTTDSATDSKQMSSSSRTLDQSGQGLTKVSSSVFNQTDIEVLDLSNNNLEGSLQAEVRHLQNLRVLDLSDNNFTGVPAEVGQLSKLEVLDLSNNPITGLPNEIGNLKNLRVLDLRGTNYAKQDLELIRGQLSVDTEIKVD